jgi:phenylpyruvate tautomerase PptA (4-oxalocrotonate tautomerase family)
MPLAKIHVVEGRYDEERLAKVSAAVQAALMNTLRVPPEDFYQLIFEFPKKRFLHTPSFVGMHYTDDLIILDLTFIEGRSKETRLALLKDVNTRVAGAASVSPDDLMITLYEAPGENFSFGQGEAQRANKNRMPLGPRRARHQEGNMSERTVRQIGRASRRRGPPTPENFCLEEVPMPATRRSQFRESARVSRAFRLNASM